MKAGHLKFAALILLVTTAFNFTNAQPNTKVTKASKAYDIKVKVTGLKDSLCYLANYFGDKQY